METCERSPEAERPDLIVGRDDASDWQKRPDLLRRFSRTPFAVSLQWMNRTVRFESNNESLLALALKFFDRYQQGKAGEAEFRWQLVCEPDRAVTSTAVPVAAFSDAGLRYASIGQRGFLAADLEKAEGVGFIPEAFLDPEAMFRTRHPLDALFCLTASSLGLVSLSGGCVAHHDRGVMVFGPPESGKTTACYIAAQSGFEFLADQMVFLDQRTELKVWGDSLNAVFRPSTLEFFPQLQEMGFHSSYGGLSFFYYDKSHLQAPKARPVIPIGSLFLVRGSEGETQLREIPADETMQRLCECVLFEEEARFDGQIRSALEAAAAKPAYELRYAEDPRIASEFITDWLG